MAGEDGSWPMGSTGVAYGGVCTPGSGLGARCVGARPVLDRYVAMAIRQGVEWAVSAFETATPRLTQEEFPPMRRHQKQTWIALLSLLVLASCAPSYKEMFLNRTYRENLSLQDEELKTQ